MSVTLRLPAITILLPFSERVLLKASLSTQDPKVLIEQNTNGKQSNYRLTLTARKTKPNNSNHIQPIRIQEPLITMKEDITSLTSQVTEESTIKPVAVDLADHAK